MELGKLAVGSKAAANLFTLVHGHKSTMPTELAAAVHRLLNTSQPNKPPPRRIVIAGPTAVNGETSTMHRRSELNDEVAQLVGLYHDSAMAALAARLPPASLAARGGLYGTADVVFWDHWVLANAGAEMTRVVRLRVRPFIQVPECHASLQR